jgi:DNA primase
MSNNLTEQIKERINIVDIVSKHVQLKKSGKNHFGLCPFHSEKSPSFSVNEDLGIYKCFGCGESGDVISFVEKVESMDFKEALEYLGREAGIKVDFTKVDSPEEKARQRLFKLNELAQKFYTYILMKHPYGEAGREYVKKRKLKLKSIEEFGIGYAPATRLKPDMFIKFAQKKGYTPKELETGGLAINKEGKIIDKFRERLMFTILDAKGRPVGFSGRVLIKSDYAPKYLNTSETLVFHKSDIAYGLYQAKEAIRKNDNVILVEGQTDVISSHQAGVKNVIAPLGTSLTEGHLKALKRFTSNLSVCFDQDLAGEMAVKRAVQMAQTQEFEVTAVPVNGVKDVDELVQKTPEVWKKSAENPIKIVEYLLDRLMERLDMQSVDDKVELISEIAPFVVSIANQIRKDHYINEISRKVEVDKELVMANLSKIAHEQTAEIKKEIKHQISTQSAQNQEQYFVGRVLQYPEVALRIRHLIVPDIFSNSGYREFVKEFLDCGSEEEIKKMLKKLAPEVKEKLSEAALVNMSEDEKITDVEEDLINVLNTMKEKYLKRELRKLNEKANEEEGNEETLEEIKRLTKELAELQKIRL